MDKTNSIKIFPIFLILSFVCVLFLSIGYAQVTYDLNVEGDISLRSQQGVVIKRVDELLKKQYYLNQNLYESLNILQEILSKLDNSIMNFKKLNTVLQKIIEIFERTDNRTRECILYLLTKYSSLFNNLIYDSISKSNDDIICVGMRESIIRMLNKSDHTMRRQCLKLLKLLPFLIDLKIKDIILFFLTDQTLMEDEKSEINDILALKGKNDSSENLI